MALTLMHNNVVSEIITKDRNFVKLSSLLRWPI